MIGSSHLYGGFNLSPSLARAMFEAVAEIHAQSLDLSLSHVDDDDCDVCKAGRAAADRYEPSGKPPVSKEERHDAPETDRPGREWAA